MGMPTVYLPPEDVWKQKAPVWARNLWQILRTELEKWCAAAKVKIALVIDPAAEVF